MIRAVLLDIDDTLLDFHGFVRQAMVEGFRHFGLPAYREEMFPVFQRVNDALWRQIEQGTLTRAQLIDLRWQRIFAQLGIQGDGRAFEKYFKEQLCRSAILMPGAAELTAWLHPRCIVCAASNGPYQQQKQRLQLAGLLPLFHHLFISEELGVQKPDPRFFQLALGRLNAALPAGEAPLTPSQLLMVGDSLTSDMRGGLDSGLRTCWLNPAGKPLPADLPVDAVVASLQEVRDVVERMGMAG